MSKKTVDTTAEKEKIDGVVENEKPENLEKKETKLSEINELKQKIDEIFIVMTEILAVVKEQASINQPVEINEPDIIEKILSSDEIKAKIIAEYLKSLCSNSSVRVLDKQVGATSLTPVNKPKTLADAKRLAEMLIKR